MGEKQGIIFRLNHDDVSTRNLIRLYLFEHLAVFALFKNQDSPLEAENTLISIFTQRKPKHAKFKSHSFSRVNEYPVTREQ